ncbi:MAG: hypothetical protein ABSC20_06780 [Candidatus Bathyarchaeia archaeon]|jgi:glycosyltransferase involved in cell wall biosynthesis
MIVKDALKQGYPFVEAIASALPICDEFLVSDGYSTDGTYEALQKISKANPKVKIHRYKWPDKMGLTMIADITNEVRSKCRFQYIFSVQAGEIIHEQSAPYIKALPTMFPTIETFSFPYISLLNKYRYAEGFRLRFSKNLPQIMAVDDAWTLGISEAFIRTKTLRSLANPQRLFNRVTNGIQYVYANTCFGEYSRAIYLPNPIFRYWSLFPKNFLEKNEGHRKLLHIPFSAKTSDILQAHINEPELFWKLGIKALFQARHKSVISYPEGYGLINRQDHPSIIQEFISNPKIDHYYIREELFELIGKL